jgi:hypothetical protein
LYKVYKNGETKELTDNDFPLFVRLWMGPWSNEDKIFIMEKGRQFKINQEISNLTFLPGNYTQLFFEFINSI